MRNFMESNKLCHTGVYDLCMSQMNIKIPTQTAKYSTSCSNFDLTNVSPTKFVIDVMHF